MLADSRGRIIASTPPGETGKTLESVLGGNQPLTAMSDRAGVMRIALANGDDVIATVRSLPNGMGQVAIVQPIDSILTGWRNRAISLLLLAAASTIVIAALGIAFFQQSARANEADQICTEVRHRIDTVLSSGRSGLWDWDIARGRIFWSDSLYELLGRQRSGDFLSFADIAQLFHPGDANPFDAATAIENPAECRIDGEFRLRHADQNWVWIRVRGRIANDGPTPHLVGIAVDITEEKAEAEQRATADRRVGDAIETISEAFALFDARNALVVANSKYQRLLALPPELMKPGTPLALIIDKTNASQVLHEEALSECEATGSRSYEMQLADGRWFQVNERATNDGGHVSVGSDITAHKAYEQSLAASNMILEQTVSDLESSRAALQRQAIKLSELAESHLEKKAEAESANRAKAEFLANMSHELRTPLNHIIGFAEMMESGIYGPLGNDRYGEYVHDIGESGRYLLGVISDILDMSSLEAGRVKLERRQIALADVIQETAGVLQPTAEARQITMEIDTAGPLHVIGDRKAFRQIIESLLGNAVKFTTEGGKAGLRAKRAGDTVQLFFEDNGGGISETDLARIGRPFEQNGAVIENGFKGSGLGFAIARSLVELHGGSIRIRSRVGIGTIVMVSLPVNGARVLLSDPTTAPMVTT
jgi:two-component system cell cycle sensor histidine kinase PleC